MNDLISRKYLYDKMLEKEELARQRVLDTPTHSPAYLRYVAQLNERTALKHEIADAPDVTDINVESKWIPCSERMPSEQDYPEQKYRVLASCSDGIVRNASIKSMLNGEKKYALGHIEFTYEAWMPLPPAFKGE